MDLSAFKIEPMGYDKLFSLGLVLFFTISMLVASFLSRRVFLLASGFGAFIQAVYLLVRPDLALTDVAQLFEKNVTFDGVHLHIARSCAAVLLVEAVMLYRLSDRDSDPTIFTSIVWSRVVVYVLSTVNFVYSYLKGSHPKSKSGSLWTHDDLMLYLMGVALMVEIFGGLFQLIRVSSWGGYPETFTRLNLHVRLDYIFVLLSGIATFALPHWFLSLETTVEKPGMLHLYLLRVTGILFIGSGLLMGRSPNFLRDNDKVTLLECRIVQNLLLILLQLYAQNWYSVFTNMHAFLGMGGVAVWTINAALGYWSVRGYPKLHAN
ncbi:uncharacterized protein LOC135480162 [Liolophura sinensis]|uniref:uncharacterized protein LOC135480162 n=1 Tax=Liolophura sinensis TaxID=3198878 RepID=UPI003158E025